MTLDWSVTCCAYVVLRTVMMNYFYILQIIMLNSSVRLLKSKTKLSNKGVRSIFWWGHDGEDDAKRKKELEASKGLISWTDPNKDVDKKKEFVWAPARMEAEADMVVGVATGMVNHVDTLKWIDKKVTKSPWHTWMTDPVEWRETMRRKQYMSLVLSQVFLRDRLKALGPDLAAAHFLCHRNCKVR